MSGEVRGNWYVGILALAESRINVVGGEPVMLMTTKLLKLFICVSQSQFCGV